MRLLFFLLLLVNIVFFAWVEGVFGPHDGGRESGRLAQQIQPERLSLARNATPPAPICRQSKPMTRSEAEQLASELRDEGYTVTLTQAPGTAGFGVRMPAQPNRAAAERKIAELKQLGITDYQLLPEGHDGGFTISLGWFSNEAAANEHLNTLSKRGVKSARIEPRERSSDKQVLTVHGTAEALKQRLSELADESTMWAECLPTTEATP